MRYGESISGSAFFSMNSLPLFKSTSSEDRSTALQNAAVLIDSRETDTRDLYTTLLTIWKFTVKESTSLEESLSAAAENPPVVILLDCVYPFEENLKKIRRLRESKLFDQTPIILLSGFAELPYRNSAIAAGADDYLVKPIDFDLLEIALKKIIGKYNHNPGKVNL